MDNSNPKTIRHQPVNQQVESYVRSLITTGEWMPGMRVPSNQMLAETTGTSVFTVQAALARLTKEGLIERKRKVGTFVTGGKVKLTCVGIYFGADLWHDPDASFYRALHGVLREKLAAAGLKVKVWIDDRTRGEHHRIFPPVKQAIDDRDIQALVAPFNDSDTVQWLRKLPVASAFLSVEAVENKVGMDWYGMFRTALHELRASGCKKVAFISMVSPSQQIEGPDGTPVNFYQCFFDEAAKLGLKTGKSWVRCPAPGEYPRDKEPFGYDQFRALWNEPEHPDGLFVFPDNVAKGVLTAVLAMQVSVPKKLKLLLHANDETPYPCPVPATFIVTKVGEVADALLGIIKLQIQGLPVKPVSFPVSVQHGDGGFST